MDFNKLLMLFTQNDLLVEEVHSLREDKDRLLRENKRLNEEVGNIILS